MLGKFTDIIILLDRSASMRKMGDATINSFNDFLREQREVEGDARLILAQFSDPFDFRFTHQFVPLNSVPNLNTLTYNPGGVSTALYDAFAKLIDEVGQRYASMPESSRPEKVLFVVITDGQNNASQKESANSVARRVKLQQDTYKWQFLFLGANQDAVLTAQELSIPSWAALTYTADQKGMIYTNQLLCREATAYRTTSNYVVNVSDDDRKKATGGSNG